MTMQIPSTTLVMVDGVRIVVPDSLNVITPYVLMEQQDWFEDEIKFVRRLLKPGQKAIDIGANYGVYTLSMARAVGPSGRVWAFEPASGTAKLLSEGIAANGYSHAVLERSALSSRRGAARLELNQSSELNALISDDEPSRSSETVPLVTLDDCMERHGWRDIDFMKIDAEGEEVNILKGGGRFFPELSPLVQYEIKAGASLHMALVRDFAALGYDSYRLVPGLDLLIPFDAESTPDQFLLNLFCCKRDRAEGLAADGFLLLSGSSRPKPGERPGNSAGEAGDRNEYGWRNTIAKLPYGTQLAGRWEHTVAAGKSAEVERALALYAVSRDASLPPVERFGALEASFAGLKELCERQPSYLRLASFARVARDYGARLLAVNSLQQLSNAILQNNRMNLNEPFLAPGKRFDSVLPGEVMGNWVLAAVLEEFERLVAFSSFYTGVSAKRRLEVIRTLGFGDAEMDSRLLLLQKRFGLPASG